METRAFLRILLFLVIDLAVLGQTFATSYTSNANGRGDWDTNSDWASNSAPPSSGINNDNITIVAGDSIVKVGSLDFNNMVTLTVEGILTVTSDFVANNNLDIIVNGKLCILGKLDVKNGAGINVSGTGIMDINGDAVFGNNGVIFIDLGGNVFIDGSLTMGNNGIITGNGNIVIGAGNGCQYVDPTSGISCSDATALPVEFLTVGTKVWNSKVVVNWSTASEENNDYFTIERSKNGVEFEEVGQIKGQGNSDVQVDYTFEDMSPLFGTSYYRVKQTDFDGAYDYSKVVKVSNKDASLIASSQLYPNPYAGGVLKVSGSGYNPSDEVKVLLVNTSGQKVFQNAVVIDNTGQFEIEIAQEKLTKGLYIYTVESELGIEYSRFVVK